MGNSIEIPFAVGSDVWWTGHSSREEMIQCPECCGQKFVTLIQGNGVQVQIDCACCTVGFDGPNGFVRRVIHEHKPTPVRLQDVEMYGKEVRYGIAANRSVDANDLFETEADCVAACKAKNEENAKYREEQAVANLKSKRRDMAWSVHYWQGQVRRFRDDLQRAEAMLDVCKAREAKKTAKVV